MESFPSNGEKDTMSKIDHSKIDIEIEEPPKTSDKLFNINIGILGHVDSGKTTLSKRISSIASTAAFDKNPQSKERGITLDLGFSALYIKTPKYLKELFPKNKKLNDSEHIQLTLVDCPGHASLIKTVIAGASIIDSMILVIDGVKGIQTQTIECILLSEILCDKICIALNKVDLLTKEKEVETKIEKLKISFSKTKFGNEIPIVPISSIKKDDNNKDVSNLLSHLLSCIDYDKVNNEPGKDSFLAFVDHCFNIKNKGTIITCTIIKGTVKVNDEIFFPELQTKKQVKEIQIFKKPVESAGKGDRVGMLIKNLDSEKIERSIICSTKSNEVTLCEGGLFLIKKVQLFKQNIDSNSKFYIMIGNQGVNASFLFFEEKNIQEKDIRKINIDLKEFYKKEFLLSPSIDNFNDYYFSFVKFDSKILIPNNMIVVGSKNDIDISQKTNRIAFFGTIIDANYQNVKNSLKIYKMKTKEGTILRINDGIAIVKGLFKKDNSTIDTFIGKKVSIKQDKSITGEILSTFGQSGKVKVKFETDLTTLKLKDNDNNDIDYKQFIVELEYKKYTKL